MVSPELAEWTLAEKAALSAGEPGEFEVRVASSSRAIHARACVSLG